MAKSSSAAPKLHVPQRETHGPLSWLPEVVAIGAMVAVLALVVAALA